VRDASYHHPRWRPTTKGGGVIHRFIHRLWKRLSTIHRLLWTKCGQVIHRLWTDCGRRRNPYGTRVSRPLRMRPDRQSTGTLIRGCRLSNSPIRTPVARSQVLGGVWGVPVGVWGCDAGHMSYPQAGDNPVDGPMNSACTISGRRG